MSFIGIVSDTKSEKIINNILKNRLEKDKNIITINEKSIVNMKNIKFETILIANSNKIAKEYREALENIIVNTKYLILNADIAIDLKIEKENELSVVTYGFNPKATITASSVEENILLCIQRKIVDINKRQIEQQEIKISVFDNMEININDIIAVATILLLYGKII